MTTAQSEARGRSGPIAALLLDYGGTLDGDALHWLDHFLALYGRLGLGFDRARIHAAFYAADEALIGEPAVAGYGLEAMVRRHVKLQLVALGRTDEAAERRLAAAFIDDTRRAWDRNRPLLRRLATRFRLGVVSNSYGNMSALLADARLGPFEIVIDSAEAGLRKPDPAIYTLAAARLGLAAGVILHVGDSWDRDVVPAHAVGMQTAWLAAPSTLMPEVPSPVWRLHSLLDLEDLLR
jgi:putative hydrolase of the HAD superfamily